ncbi:MAG: hydantoinase/oxoprolinase family protein [Defluviicoccus sp.]|nr:hydantoinase/oxoprolinase family protein [Defluviicoccus sp.]
MPRARLAADVGGTFTDIAVEHDGRLATTKVLTTPQAPEEGVLAGIARALSETGLAPGAFELAIHGTTLATNAIIQRRGAKTALLVTEGFRDVVEMAFENRFEQYDIYTDRPEPLVPRHLRLGVRERLDARGNVLVPLEPGALDPIVETLKEEAVEAVAVGFIHAYVDGRHERAVHDLLADAMPGLAITLSSEVSPEIREYERWSTAAANAYVQPLMAGYIARLERALSELGFSCPLYLMTSGGGLARPETGRRFPIRLVESGPAGGAILAAHIARQCALERVLSFDMGGTTAKICLIDDGEPQASRSFEVAREYRFLKGSGLPLRIPVIEMVEIGAGGGSIARTDAMGRLTVGPDSAGSDPGPVCYAQGGVAPTVTDADVTLGWIDPAAFAGGTIPLDAGAAVAAIAAGPGEALGLDAHGAAHGIAEVVVENMANAARVHAVERGKTLGERTLIAFGGAAPVHAARLAEKLGIGRILIPQSAGVGSAVGFLRAPVAYEVVRSLYAALDGSFDADAVNALLEAMREEADAIVAAAAPGARLVRARAADMRYRGQGHELAVGVPAGPLGPDSREALIEAFEAAYARTYSRTIPGLTIEAMNWTLRVAAEADPPAPCPPMPDAEAAEAMARRPICDPATAGMAGAPVFSRNALAPGARIAGPAVIAEDETTTIVLDSFSASIDALGNIVIARDGS